MKGGVKHLHALGVVRLLGGRARVLHAVAEELQGGDGDDVLALQ
jgi:hypothetical protein